MIDKSVAERGANIAKGRGAALQENDEWQVKST